MNYSHFGFLTGCSYQRGRVTRGASPSDWQQATAWEGGTLATCPGPRMSARAAGTRVRGAAGWAGHKLSPPPGGWCRRPPGRADTPPSRCAATRQRPAAAGSKIERNYVSEFEIEWTHYGRYKYNLWVLQRNEKNVILIWYCFCTIMKECTLSSCPP